jgi:uncharacterized protein YecE (DUF72 family)
MESGMTNKPSPLTPLYVGTSGWAYAAWKPQFYPQKLAAKNFLKHYATQLNAVEVNYTFRRLLSEKAALSWVADTGPEFRFCLKASQFITHIRQLKDPATLLDRFLPTLQPLAAQLGPILFQLPPQLKADATLLDDFLANLPRNVKSAFEFRHKSWFADDTYEVLKKHNAALCIAESESLVTPEERTAEYIYFRFRKPSYGPDDLREVAARISKCLKDGVETYAFFKHEEDPRSPLYAVDLLETAGKQLAG